MKKDELSTNQVPCLSDAVVIVSAFQAVRRCRAVGEGRRCESATGRSRHLVFDSSSYGGISNGLSCALGSLVGKGGSICAVGPFIEGHVRMPAGMAGLRAGPIGGPSESRIGVVEAGGAANVKKRQREAFE